MIVTGSASEMATSLDGCPVESDNSAILAPQGFGDAEINALGSIIHALSTPDLMIAGPTPSGLFRLRVRTESQCSWLREILQNIRVSASRCGLRIVELGRDGELGPVPEPEYSEVKEAGFFDPEQRGLGPEFAAVGIQRAWSRTHGDPNVWIAIVDTGVQMDHPNLSRRIWSNSKERGLRAGVDDDRNDIVDDIRGVDFSASLEHGVPYENAIGENNSHGTDSAFVTAGEPDFNGKCAGIAQNSKIIPIKFIKGADASDFDFARAIEYAAAVGAAIVNVSISTPRYLPATRRAIDYAATRDVLIVAAAGNEYTDLCKQSFYPAAFSLEQRQAPNQIVVMSVVLRNLEPSQTYSRAAVHIAAPIAARVPRKGAEGFRLARGSSISAPYVSGVAALVKSLNPEWWTFQRIKDHLIASGTYDAGLAAFSKYGKFLNADNAVAGPLELIVPESFARWYPGSEQELRWNLRFQSDHCVDVIAEYRLTDQNLWRRIARCRAAARRHVIDTNKIDGKQGHIRLRCQDSNFTSDVIRFEIG